MVKAFAALCSLLLVCGLARGQEFRVEKSEVGTVVSLNGKWHFKSAGSEKEVTVPVPQMLSRIQWWLDDSEDFKKWEQARLDALGFDTEKTDEGTYRATIELPAEWPSDRRLWVEFEGVAMRSRTSINGQEVGKHDGMFSRFAYDLTPHLRPGRNELTVWASMEKIPPTSASLGEAVTVNLSAAKVISMSKGMFGPLTPNQDNRAYDLYGIWQPVKLVVRGNAKIDDVWFQPTLSGCKVEIETDPAGSSDKGTFRFRLFDAVTNEPLENGNVAGNNMALNERGRLEVENLEPKLWTPAEPNLYRLEVTLESPGGQVLDRWSKKVGFRTFEVKGNQFHLNGKPYWLRGANQLPYGKNPWDAELPRKLIRYLHDGNINSTRTHCTPWNEAWLAAADEIGLAVSIEGIRPWAFAGKQPEGKPQIMPPAEIVQHWLMENQDVVRRCRNHPSVFLFTVGNEMLLRDNRNLAKWKILSDVTKQTRALAPRHPIVVSSDYVRDAEFYESALKPAGIDDGDVDDVHRYNGWYANSGFVVEPKFDPKGGSAGGAGSGGGAGGASGASGAAGGARPLIGQEMATGYPDLDTGLPVLRYTRDLLTPQAWVGNFAYPGNDPAVFLDHHATVTKRWAEVLRTQRGTAGFSLFSAECWFRHSYAPDATPYPVYAAVKQAFAPVGLALETTRRRFYAGEPIATGVHVTNDDEQARDLSGLHVICQIDGGTPSEPAAIERLAYYATVKVPVNFTVPAGDNRRSALLVTRLMQGEREISRTSDAVEIFPRPAATRPTSQPNVILVEAGKPLAGLSEGQPLRQQIDVGATAIVFSPTKEIVNLFPADLLDARADLAEFADGSPCAGTKLAEDLRPMDLKWWARKGDARAFVAATSHRLKAGGRARELVRYIPAHAYIPRERVPEQYRCVLSEIPLGKGRLWICDLDLAASADVDPAAALFRDNLLRAAADPLSTRTLPTVPTHEALLGSIAKPATATAPAGAPATAPATTAAAATRTTTTTAATTVPGRPQ